jgi:lipopolysaccharide export system permease protein
MKSVRRSPTMDLHLVGSFLPVFIGAMLFFVLILQMAELLINIVQFMQNEVKAEDIFRSMLLYLPKCISFALPIALLFSVSYLLGTMYANNELMIVLGSGIPLVSLVLPLFLTSLLLSAGLLVFEERIVIPATVMRKDFMQAALRTGVVAGASDVTIVGEQGRLIWNIRFFDIPSSTMTGVTVIERDEQGRILSRLDAQAASWTGEAWRFSGVRRFIRTDNDMFDQTSASLELPGYNEQPDAFRSGGRSVDELPVREARAHLEFLMRAGLPSIGPWAEYYRRFSYALTPIIVVMLSAALTGLVRKNILLISLLVSLISATAFYVMQMLSMLMAKSGMIPAPFGAFAPVLFFALLIPLVFRFRNA